MPPSFSLKLGRSRASSDVVGLDVQPGFVAAVKARVNGSILAERAAVAPLDTETVREGEVVDVDALTEALRELFSHGGLGKHVRVGIANQRTVMRTLDLPPVTDRKELAAAVRFSAQDQVPMPLANAVLDFHPLGLSDTPAGTRQRVVLVAAQRDMVERLLAAVRGAGLTPEGVDLSAFALIRSLHHRADDGGEDSRVLYLNVDGLTNLAIAEGTICRFTRVIGGGVEGMASELAARRGIALAQARELLASVDLSVAPTPTLPAVQPSPEPSAHADESDEVAAEAPSSEPEGEAGVESSLSREDHEAREASMGYAEVIAAAADAGAAQDDTPQGDSGAEQDVRAVLENGIRDISGEVRNSIDFHRTQDQGGQVSHLSLSGAALDLPGFADALQASLGIEVRRESVGLVDAGLGDELSINRLAVAAGLATLEAPQ